MWLKWIAFVKRKFYSAFNVEFKLFKHFECFTFFKKNLKHFYLNVDIYLWSNSISHLFFLNGNILVYSVKNMRVTCSHNGLYLRILLMVLGGGMEECIVTCWRKVPISAQYPYLVQNTEHRTQYFIDLPFFYFTSILCNLMNKQYICNLLTKTVKNRYSKSKNGF